MSDQSAMIQRIKEICDEFDSRVTEVGLAFARLEVAKAMAELEAAQASRQQDVEAGAREMLKHIIAQTMTDGDLSIYELEDVDPAAVARAALAALDGK